MYWGIRWCPSHVLTLKENFYLQINRNLAKLSTFAAFTIELSHTDGHFKVDCIYYFGVHLQAFWRGMKTSFSSNKFCLGQGLFPNAEQCVSSKSVRGCTDDSNITLGCSFVNAILIILKAVVKLANMNIQATDGKYVPTLIEAY